MKQNLENHERNQEKFFLLKSHPLEGGFFVGKFFFPCYTFYTYVLICNFIIFFFMKNFSELNFTKHSDGLIPTVVQHAENGKILMVGFSNPESLKISQEKKLATFYSRSQQKLWTKGETSGNTLDLKAIQFDCDADTLLFFALPNGPTCHTGEQTCFFQGEKFQTDAESLWSVYDTVRARKKGITHEDSYVTSLFERGLDRIAQKVGEEAIETVIASKNDDRDDFIGEFSDLLFHMMVLLAEKNITMTQIVAKFEERKKK